MFKHACWTLAVTTVALLPLDCRAGVPPAAPSDALLPQLGQYFSYRDYQPTPLPNYHASKALLPAPVFDARPDYLAFYDRAWQLGFDHFKAPPAGSPLIKNFIDEAFNENIFLWDMSFSTFWGNYAHRLFPAIEGLDNFYRMQLPDGEILREIGERDGQLGVKGWSEPGTEGNLNHPMLAWAELMSYRMTADKDRLVRVYLPLKKYRESFNKIYHPPCGHYLTDKGAMDDSPRNATLLCGVDTAAQMVLFDRWLAEIASLLNHPDEARHFNQRADEYAQKIQRDFWDEALGFYVDIGLDLKPQTMRTIAGFWPLLAGIADQQQLQRLIQQLQDPQAFNTRHRVPSHPLNETGFAGNYWDGGVWAPTNTMVIEGLARYGEHALAREIALNHLDSATHVFTETGTAWENYYPLDYYKGLKARPDFVGWSGLAPIHYLIRYAIGIAVDAPNNTVSWEIHEPGRHGIERLSYRLANGQWNQISLVAEPANKQGKRLIHSQCQYPFSLKVTIEDSSRTYWLDCNRGSLEVQI